MTGLFGSALLRMTKLDSFNITVSRTQMLLQFFAFLAFNIFDTLQFCFKIGTTGFVVFTTLAFYSNVFGVIVLTKTLFKIADL